jgi:hypothetical protein
MKRIRQITKPQMLYSRMAVLEKPCPVPAKPGVYGWFFKEIPGVALTDGCVTMNGLTLLYVGISPDKIGKPNSKQNIRKRITNHYRGNAAGSTLRRSLGILLVEQSGFPLRRVGSGKRMTFTHIGEQWLDVWMGNNAYVCWLEDPTPWVLEKDIIQSVSLPLNIRDNQHHPFPSELTRMRRGAIRAARDCPVAREDNQKRQA